MNSISISRSDTLLGGFFLGFIKVHILYHASEDPVCGVEIIEEIRRHGYLRSSKRVVQDKVRKCYEITERELTMLKKSREKIKELLDEVLR